MKITAEKLKRIIASCRTDEPAADYITINYNRETNTARVWIKYLGGEEQSLSVPMDHIDGSAPVSIDKGLASIT